MDHENRCSAKGKDVGMANYLFSIVAASVFVAVLCAAAPDGEGVGKFVAFAGALTVALVALSPLAGGVDAWVDGIRSEWGSELQDTSIQDEEQSAKYLAYNIAMTASEIYGLELQDVSVSVCPAKDVQTFTPEAVQIALPAGTSLDTDEASETLSKLFSCAISVEIKERGTS